MRKLGRAIQNAAWDFLDDDCMSSGAAIAYYTMFSLPPLLVIVFLVAGTAGVSEQQIEQVVQRQLGAPVSQSLAAPPEPRADAEAESAAPWDRQIGIGRLGLASKVVGGLVLLFAATGVFAQLQYALNRAWEVEPDPEQGIVRSFLFKRLLSLGMIVVIAFLLLVSLVVTTLLNEIVAALQGEASGTFWMALGVAVNNAAAWAMATLLFAAMFKILPDAKMWWRDVWIGAAMTGLLFVLGKALIGWYLRYSNIGASWGSAAASVVALLVWVYYSALIVLLGAELTQSWAKQYGHGIEPAKGAVRKQEFKRYLRDDATSQ